MAAAANSDIFGTMMTDLENVAEIALVLTVPGIEWIGSDDADTHSGSVGDDTLSGRGGNDFILGGAGNDSIYGGNDNDTLQGGLGSDLLEGGSGFDFISYANATNGLTVSLASPTINTGEAIGDAYDSIQGVIGSAFNDWLIGNIDINHLKGGEGHDTLEGGAGSDTLEGGAGNDVYIDPLGDMIIDVSGIDTIRTSRSFSLTDSVAIENLVALDPAAPTNLELSGNALANTLIGTRGANLLDGRGGADILLGGLGDDTYHVDLAQDQVREGGGGGFDTVIASSSYAVALDAEIEVLKFADSTSKAAQYLYGSNSSNVITGSAGNNTLKGYGGKDLVKGEAGSDRLYGGSGNDTLFGGSGNDRLYGEAGRDTFVFDTKTSKTNIDRIYKYEAKDDSIWLDNAVFTKLGKGSLSKPQKLKSKMFALGDKAKDASDRIIYDKAKGVLYYDKDGTGSAGKLKIATLDKKIKITHHDFFVI